MLHFIKGIQAITFIYKCIVISIYIMYCFIRFSGLLTSLGKVFVLAPQLAALIVANPLIIFFYHTSSPGL